MLSRGCPLALLALLACCEVGHARALDARHPRLRRAAVTTETPVDQVCDNVTDASAAHWAVEASEDDMMTLLMSHGGLPWQGDKDSKYLEDPDALPFLSRRPAPEDHFDDEEEDEDEKIVKDKDEEQDKEEEDKDEKDKDEKDKDEKDKDEKDKDEKDETHKGTDELDTDANDEKEDGKDEKEAEDIEDEDEGADDVDHDLLDYFPDFFNSNPEESLKYNYSASDFAMFIRVERAISIPRERLLQAVPQVVGVDDDVPEVVEGVVGELWWAPDDRCKRVIRNLAYVMLVRPGSRLATRFQLQQKKCQWPHDSISLHCEGPDAAAPFDNQGSDVGLLLAERLLGLPVHVHNATAT